uniref:Substance P n=2 Tax=Gadus morhua TaxID=8049 RepID=TKNA_GADMO|nr:RecName: Full=Substance P [Gadus morhua]
KPRPQQFIGLM